MDCTNRLGAEYEEDWGPCGDEGRVCQDCEEKSKAEFLAHVGIRPGMTRAQRQNQLEAFRPVSTVTQEEWAEWKRLKE